MTWKTWMLSDDLAVQGTLFQTYGCSTKKGPLTSDSDNLLADLRKWQTAIRSLTDTEEENSRPQSFHRQRQGKWQSAIIPKIETGDMTDSNRATDRNKRIDRPQSLYMKKGKWQRAIIPQRRGKWQTIIPSHEEGEMTEGDHSTETREMTCLLYTSDAADES